MKTLLLLPVLFLLSSCSEKTADHSKMDHSTMDHQGIELSGGTSIPTVDLVVHPDAKSGWNLQVLTSNFQFAPKNASHAHIEGEGHAHIYVNDEKLTRLYSEWYYLGSLPHGKNQIRIDLNANNHSPFLYEGNVISDSEVIVNE